MRKKFTEGKPVNEMILEKHVNRENLYNSRKIRSHEIVIKVIINENDEKTAEVLNRNKNGDDLQSEKEALIYRLTEILAEEERRSLLNLTLPHWTPADKGDNCYECRKLTKWRWNDPVNNYYAPRCNSNNNYDGKLLCAVDIPKVVSLNAVMESNRKAALDILFSDD